MTVPYYLIVQSLGYSCQFGCWLGMPHSNHRVAWVEKDHNDRRVSTPPAMFRVANHQTRMPRATGSASVRGWLRKSLGSEAVVSQHAFFFFITRTHMCVYIYEQRLGIFYLKKERDKPAFLAYFVCVDYVLCLWFSYSDHQVRFNWSLIIPFSAE